MATSCPHCNAECLENSQFCQSCGKAVQAISSVPKIFEDTEDIAQTVVGKKIQGMTLEKAMTSAKRCLFAVGILQLLAGAAFYAGFRFAEEESVKQELLIMLTGVGLIGILYIVLGLWAKRSPLPASIVGLVLYVSLLVFDGISDPAAIARGWIMKIIVLMVLVKGIKAGIQYRKLKTNVVPPVQN